MERDMKNGYRYVIKSRDNFTRCNTLPKQYVIFYKEDDPIGMTSLLGYKTARHILDAMSVANPTYTAVVVDEVELETMVKEKKLDVHDIRYRSNDAIEQIGSEWLVFVHEKDIPIPSQIIEADKPIDACQTVDRFAISHNYDPVFIHASMAMDSGYYDYIKGSKKLYRSR